MRQESEDPHHEDTRSARPQPAGTYLVQDDSHSEEDNFFTKLTYFSGISLQVMPIF